LALWYMLMLAVPLGAFSIAIYQGMRGNLLGEVNTDVQQRAALLAAAVEPTNGSDSLRRTQLDVFTTPDIFLQTMDEHGAVVDRSSNLESQILPLLPQSIAENKVTEVTVGKSKLVLYGRAVTSHGQLRGYALVARSPRVSYIAL